MTTIRGISTEQTTPDGDNVYIEGDDTAQALPAGSVKMTLNNALNNSTLGQQAFRSDHSAEINGLTEKAIPLSEDLAVIECSASSYAKRKVQLEALVGIIAATKRSVRVATSAAGTLATSFANGQTVNGVTVATGDRILVKDQASGSENGVYVVQASGAPQRAVDMPTGFGAAGSVVVTREGTASSLSFFICSNAAGSDVVGTDALTFAQPSVGGVDTSTANQVAITANSESVVVDNDSATPSLRGDVDDTWTLGEPAIRWNSVFAGGGSVGAPSLSVGESDVGLYQPASGQVGISTDGSATLVVDGVLDAATGNEVAYDQAVTVNKATSGDYIAWQLNVTETAAPGTANKLSSWQVGGVEQAYLTSGGNLVSTNAGTTAAPSIAVRDESHGIYSPATNQVGLVANNEAIIVDNDSATPSLRPDVDSTWYLGEAATAWLRVYADNVWTDQIATQSGSLSVGTTNATSILSGLGSTPWIHSGSLRLNQDTSPPTSGTTDNVELFAEAGLLKLLDENSDVTILSPQGEGTAITGTTHSTDQDADQQPRDCSNASGCTVTVNSAYAGCLLGPYFASTASQTVTFSNGTATLAHLDATLTAVTRGQNAKAWILYLSASTYTLLGELAAA